MQSSNIRKGMLRRDCVEQQSSMEMATAVWHCISGYSGLPEATQAPLVFDDSFHASPIQILRSAEGLAGAEAEVRCRGTVKARRAFDLADTLGDLSTLDLGRHTNSAESVCARQQSRQRETGS